MEDSPITLAHTHARNAVLETRRSNPVAASEEHDLAAVEFAHAAQHTHDAEALRTLRLLEEHHSKLGKLLRFRHEHPQSQSAEKQESLEPAEEVKSIQMVSVPPAQDTSKHPTSPSPGPDALQQPPRLARASRPTARDLSSSIASNLASARGIPGGHRRGGPASPTISAQHAPGKFGKDQATARGAQVLAKSSKIQPDFFNSNHQSNDSKPPWAPPTHIGDEESAASANDAPFQQFYNTLESLMSKISAPLAFAGLPLTSTTKVTSQDDTHKDTKKPPSPILSKDLDYSQLISRAALRAVQDGRFTSTNPAESFYVVPTTGGTVSYAEIMSRADHEATTRRHTRHLSNLSEDNMEDFVDAKETLPASANSAEIRAKKPPNPPTRPRKLLPLLTQPSTTTTTTPSSIHHHQNALEELTLANTTLKQNLDKLSKRLHIFEASAQSSSAALAYSIRSLAAHPSSPSPSPSSNPNPNPTTNVEPTTTTTSPSSSSARITELEDLLRKNERELTRRDRENAKLNENLARYRDKWESLKKGAKARREAGAGAGALGLGNDKGGAKSNNDSNVGGGSAVERKVEDAGGGGGGGGGGEGLKAAE